eukprot:SAG31_NODE_842_length_11586_cov_9.084966_3_plen_51_part_00
MIGFESDTATSSVYFEDAGDGNPEAGTADVRVSPQTLSQPMQTVSLYPIT